MSVLTLAIAQKRWTEKMSKKLILVGIDAREMI